MTLRRGKNNKKTNAKGRKMALAIFANVTHLSFCSQPFPYAFESRYSPW